MNPYKSVVTRHRQFLAVCLVFWSGTVSAELPTLEEIYQTLELQPTAAMTSELKPILADYSKRKHHKALAVAISPEDYSIGYGYKAPSEIGASQTAMSHCEKFRQENNNGGQCEILLSGERLVLPGFALKRPISADSNAMAWRVEGPNSVLYLVGTLHVLKPSLLPLPPVFDQMFQNADQVVFEVNPFLMTDPERIAEMQQLLRVDAKEQKAAYDRETKKVVKRYTKSQGIPTDAAYTVLPVINAIQVSQLQMSALGYSSNTGVEMHYARQASVFGKAVLELETQAAAMLPMISLPMNAQLLMLRETINQLDTLPDMLELLIQTWLRGDAEVFYQESARSISVHPQLASLSNALLDQRNQQWLDQIEDLLEQPKSSVVMVGAAHMGGKNGLLALLRARGFEPEQQKWGTAN